MTDCRPPHRLCVAATVAWLVILVVTASWVDDASAADVTARDVTTNLFQANASAPVDYSRKDLSLLDLAGLDFKGAVLRQSDLYGADLTRARLKGSDLTGARLDRASVSGADFSNANLRGVSMLTVSAHLTMEPNPADAPVFRGADLRDAHLASRLDGADFRFADLSGARIGKLVATWGSYRPRAVFNNARFDHAKMRGTDMSTAVMRFTNFTGADLTGANLRKCDLTQADFSGANLQNADFTGADLDGAVLNSAIGVADAVGLTVAVPRANPSK